MKVDHLVNGEVLPGKTYFEDINPSTQEVLAEVAAGGEAEINAAVTAAKAAFPAWAARPATERALLLRSLGDLITDVPGLIEYLSSFMTLSAGDVILTGTPEGVVNVNEGDEGICEIEGIGQLQNTLVSDAVFGRGI